MFFDNPLAYRKAQAGSGILRAYERFEDAITEIGGKSGPVRNFQSHPRGVRQSARSSAAATLLRLTRGRARYRVALDRDFKGIQKQIQQDLANLARVRFDLDRLLRQLDVDVDSKLSARRARNSTVCARTSRSSTGRF